MRIKKSKGFRKRSIRCARLSAETRICQHLLLLSTRNLRHLPLLPALVPALAGWELSTGPPHGLARLDLRRCPGRGACKLLGWRRLLGDLLHQPAHPLLLLLLGYGQQQEVLGRRYVIVHWRWIIKTLVFISKTDVTE